MASISGKTKAAPVAKIKRPVVDGKTVNCINIRFAENGMIVTMDFEQPKSTRNGMIGRYIPSSEPMVFTQPGDTLSYLEKCLPKSEHDAHEKGEAEGKY
jgi:hypothetical protein